MEKGRGKGTDTLQTENVFTRKEYIEREAVVMKIREWFWSAPGVHPKLDRDTAEEILFAIPAADVVPVRHGCWIELENGDCKCSLCGCYHHAWEAHGYYCQHCGARMDGDGELKQANVKRFPAEEVE